MDEKRLMIIIFFILYIGTFFLCMIYAKLEYKAGYRNGYINAAEDFYNGKLKVERKETTVVTYEWKDKL